MRVLFSALLAALCWAGANAACKETTARELKKLLNAPLSDHKHVFAEFYAPWCGHCKSLAPKWDWVADKVARDAPTSVAIVKIDADKHGQEVGEYNIAGFPTLVLFVAPEDAPATGQVKRTRVDFHSAREPKPIIQFINNNCGTALTWDDYVAPPTQREDVSPTQQKLYDAFAKVNEFKFSAARKLLTEISMGDDVRTGRSANRMLAKLNTIGLDIGELVVDDWLQVNLETFDVPDLTTGTHLLARLDFRSASRAELEPMIEEVYNVKGVGVVRLTGPTDGPIPSDIPYPVALTEEKQVLTGKGLEEEMMQLQSALLIHDHKVIWQGHVGILDKTLVATLKAFAAGKALKDFDVEDCGSAAEGDDEGSCAPPAHTHDEL